MGKLEYMLWCIKNNKHLERAWLLSVFGILADNTKGDGLAVVDGHFKAFMPGSDEGIDIDGYQAKLPVFDRNECILLKAGDLPCIKQDMESTYGILIINALLVDYPYGGIVEYINGEITPDLMNRTAYKALLQDNVTIEMHHRFENSANYITCLSQTAVPSATRKSITPNPEVARLKPILLEEYKDRLNDPAAVAELQAKIAAIDKEYLKGDPAERFFIKSKSVMSRLRTGGIYGAEPDFEDESKISVMTNSLAEGWSVKDLPMMANNIRGGSFNRGANTALGGAAVKETARVFQNYTMTQNDCLTKRGMPHLLNQDNYKDYAGRYVIGHEEPLTEEILKSLIGKYIDLRTPATCATVGTTICTKCLGDTTSNSGIGINALMMEVTSKFLDLFMALMHSSVLTTARYNFKNRIT